MRKINEIGKKSLTLLLAFIMVVTLVPLNLLVIAEDVDPETLIGSKVRIVNDVLYMYREAGSYAIGCDKSELPEVLVILDVETMAWGSTTKVYYKLGTVGRASNAVLNTHSWTEDYNVQIIEYDEGNAPLTVDDMKVGKRYRATLDSSETSTMYLFKLDENGEVIQHYGSVLKSSLPQELTVILLEEGDFFVYVTNEDWPATYDDYRLIEPVDIIILECLDNVSDEGLIEGEVGLTSGGEVIEELTIAKGEKEYIFTQLSNKIGEAGKYQWQLLIDKENNHWANVADYCYPYATISEALIANACDEEGKATLRCIVTSGEDKYVSGNVTVTVTEPTAELSNAVSPSVVADNVSTFAPKKVRGGGTTRASDEYTEYQIEVNYHYLHATAVDPTLNGRIAAPTVTITLGTGASYTGTIYTPPVLGYKPYVTEEMAQTLGITYTDSNKVEYPAESGNFYVPAPEISFEHRDSAISVMVHYIPQQVNFTVKIYHQNPKDDEYTVRDTIIVNEPYAVADAAVGEGLNTFYEGFKSLYYDPATVITGDGMTVVDIYYDREYYLVDFDLKAPGGTGYGVVPMYVRYDTAVMIGTPTNPGYTFDGWELTRVYTVDADTKVETTITNETIRGPYDIEDGGRMVTVRHNLDYKAKWQVATTSYTIAYWLEDPEYVDPADPKDVKINEKYKIWGTRNITNVTTDTVVDGPAAGDVPAAWVQQNNVRIKSDSTETRNINLLNYLDFVSSDQNVKVQGDGSTVVNVYYDRKEYTLKFYYARSTRSNNRTTWYVAGQTDAGTSFVLTKSNDELTCLNNNSGSFGQVASQPTLKDGVAVEKRYILDSETSGNNTYYYLSFKAKYGADISDQYPCDIFNSVERTGTYNNSGWSDKTVLMSAWSGEYNVMFSRVGGNKTMKGKYQVLDYRMLWDPTADGWRTAYNDNTVSYLAFWENAINAGWNVPELYRYKIWVQVLDGQTLSPDTKYYTYTDSQGRTLTYYLKDVYDTCDNSQVSEQTQPTMIGFEQNGRTNRGNIANNTYNNWTNTPDLTRDEVTEIRNLMKGQYNEAWIVNYFYTRNSATLSFNDTYTTPEEIPIPYEQSLSDYATKVPQYPSSVENGAMKFAGDLDGDGIGDGTGWYLDESYTLPFSFDTLMGVDNIYLYAKWEPTTWNVKVYNDKAIMEETPENTVMNVTVEFGEMIKEPTYTKINDNYIFAGWYYMEEGEEKRFDFNTMQIKKDYVIYAKWTSKVPVPYTIYYKMEVDGVLIEIADPTVGKSLAGISKTFIAKVEEQLDAGYREGYYPTERSHSLLMSAEHPNEITFYYKTLTEVTYTVEHVFVDKQLVPYLGTDTFIIDKLHPVKEPDDASPLISVSFRDMAQEEIIKEELKKQYPALTTTQIDDIWKEIIVDLSPNAYMQELILVTDSSKNKVIFEWADRGVEAIYEIIYKTQDLDDKNSYSIYKIQQEKGQVGHSYTLNVEDIMEITGFTLDKEKSKLSGVVSKPLENDGGLTLTLYYTRDYYTYTIDHYMRGTMEKLKDTETKKVLFGTEVTENAANDIAGYHVVSESSVTVKIINQNQPIIFYYDADDISYVYSVGAGKGVLSSYGEKVSIVKDPKGCIPQPNNGYIFAGWYTDPTCQTSVTSDIATVVTDPGDNYGKIIPKNPTVAPDSPIYFYAKFVPTSLTIQNSFSAAVNPHPALDMAEQGFIYSITGAEDSNRGVATRVAVVGYGSKTIMSLPIGEYTITVENAWSWRYDSILGVTIGDRDPLAFGGMSWTIYFDGLDIMVVTYGIPGPDISGTTEANSSYFITDNANNEPN